MTNVYLSIGHPSVQADDIIATTFLNCKIIISNPKEAVHFEQKVKLFVCFIHDTLVASFSLLGKNR